MRLFRFIIHFNNGQTLNTESMSLKSGKKARKYARVLSENPDTDYVEIQEMDWFWVGSEGNVL